MNMDYKEYRERYNAACDEFYNKLDEVNKSISSTVALKAANPMDPVSDDIIQDLKRKWEELEGSLNTVNELDDYLLTTLAASGKIIDPVDTKQFLNRNREMNASFQRLKFVYESGINIFSNSKRSMAAL